MKSNNLCYHVQPESLLLMELENPGSQIRRWWSGLRGWWLVDQNYNLIACAELDRWIDRRTVTATDRR